MSTSWDQPDHNGANQGEMPLPEPVPHNPIAVASAPPAPHAPADSHPGNIDQIREILFGSHIRDYETRFVRLEQALLKEAADVRESARQRIDGLETFVKHELETLQGKLKGERDERLESGAGLLKKIVDVDDRASHAIQEARDQLMQHGRSAAEQLAAKEREIGALLEKRFEELKKDKTDRSALAALFSEVALRLNHEFRLPGDTH